MREISYNRKISVIKLFFDGQRYDDIALEVGISKGSVVNIIDEFRDGYLPITLPMNEYLDALHQLAVDLMKNNTSVAQVKCCLKINNKVREMGVGIEQVEQWLDSCQEIASSSVSNNEFVGAALELAELRAANGLTYGELLTEYKDKSDSLKRLDKGINNRNKELSSIKQETLKTTDELNSITKAIVAARKDYAGEKDSLKLEQDKYLADNKLSWQKIELVEAVLNSALSSSKLSKAQQAILRNKIITAGSLAKEVKHLERRKRKIQEANAGLIQCNIRYGAKFDENKRTSYEWDISILKKADEKHRLEKEIESKRAELAKLEEKTSNNIKDLYTSHLIIDFLFDKNGLIDYDLNRLVDMMVALRQKRLGIGPKQVTDVNGNVVCECDVPRINTGFEANNLDIEKARESFAYLILPLIKDKFVLKSDYDLAQANHQFSEKCARIEGVLAGRQQNRFF